MNRIISLCVILLSFASIDVFSQSITIDECYQLAEKNYPLNKQRNLLHQAKDKNLSNATSGYFPKINIITQATYQSEVPHIDLNFPGINLPSPDKFQYKSIAEINQVIYDGGIISNQNKLIEANNRLEEKKLDVELYKIKEKITELYFGIIMLQQQNEIIELSKSDLHLMVKKIQSQVDNGVALKSNVNILKAEILKLEQNQLELNSEIKSSIYLLSDLIGKELNDNVTLINPEEIPLSKDIQRPEIEMFKEQSSALDAQKGMILAKNLPKLFAFFQGGYGNPTLNLFNENPGWYYITGVNLNIPITGFYNQSRDYELININKQSNEVMKETFIFNTKLEIIRQEEALNKYKLLLEKDDELIGLRSSIKQVASAQLENGVINSNDYIKELNAEEIAKLNKTLHKLKSLLIQYKNKITIGK